MKDTTITYVTLPEVLIYQVARTIQDGELVLQLASIKAYCASARDAVAASACPRQQADRHRAVGIQIVAGVNTKPDRVHGCDSCERDC